MACRAGGAIHITTHIGDRWPHSNTHLTNRRHKLITGPNTGLDMTRHPAYVQCLSNDPNATQFRHSIKHKLSMLPENNYLRLSELPKGNKHLHRAANKLWQLNDVRTSDRKLMNQPRTGHNCLDSPWSHAKTYKQWSDLWKHGRWSPQLINEDLPESDIEQRQKWVLIYSQHGANWKQQRNRRLLH